MKQETAISGGRKHFDLKQFVRSLFSTKPKAIVTIVIAVLVVGCMVALAAGWLVVVAKTPGQKVVVSANVCDTDVVNKFNTTMTSYYKGTLSGDISTELSSQISNFKKNSSYTQDPSCLFIEYTAAAIKGDGTTATDIAGKIRKLADAGKFVDNRINSMTSLTGMEQAATQLSPREEPEFDDN